MDRESSLKESTNGSALSRWFTIDVSIVTDFVRNDVILAKNNCGLDSGDTLSNDVFVRMLEVAGYARRAEHEK